MELFYWWVCGWLIRCFSLIPYFLGGFYLENLLSSSICISLVFSLDFSNCFIEIFCLIWSLLPNLISTLLFQVYSVKLFLYKCLQSVKCFGIWFSLNIFILVYWHRTFWNFWDLFDKSWKNFIAMFWFDWQVNSIWFKLFIYHLTGNGPLSLLLVKGTKLRRLPRAFQVYLLIYSLLSVHFILFDQSDVITKTLFSAYYPFTNVIQIFSFVSFIYLS